MFVSKATQAGAPILKKFGREKTMPQPQSCTHKQKEQRNRKAKAASIRGSEFGSLRFMTMLARD
jgi:hypothetical protein